MTGPVAHFGPRDAAREAEAQPEGPQGWDWFRQALAPLLQPDQFRPDDQLLIEIARYSETEIGRKVFDWLHALTDRAPYPSGDFKAFEEAAIAAAKHAGRAGVGHVLTRAVAEGRKLRDAQSKG